MAAEPRRRTPGPDRGHRIYATQTVRISKVIGAPVDYVYAWCTDYRPDDSELSVSRPKPRFQVVRLAPRRLLRIRVTDAGRRDPRVAVDLLRLQPPRSWHTDQIDEEDRESVDYRLTSLSPTRTRLDLLITERWMIPSPPSRADVRRRARGAWDRYALALEERYRAGRPARG